MVDTGVFMNLATSCSGKNGRSRALPVIEVSAVGASRGSSHGSEISLNVPAYFSAYERTFRSGKTSQCRPGRRANDASNVTIGYSSNDCAAYTTNHVPKVASGRVAVVDG